MHSALRDAILNGLLQPGGRLDVAELAEKLDVSLTPVRDALQLLARRRLGGDPPRSGTFVARLSARDVRETFDVRCALEAWPPSRPSAGSPAGTSSG